jgi:hypothetical protein
VKWPLREREVLHLQANLSDLPCEAAPIRHARVLHSSVHAAASVTQLTAWEVRWVLEPESE